MLVFQSEGMNLKVEEIGRVDGIPWGMTLIGDDDVLVSLRDGRFLLLNLQDASRKEFLLDNVFSKGECGLMDVKKSPDFKNTSRVYFTYAKNIDGNGFTTLSTARILDGSIVEISDLFTTSHTPTDDGRHCGSRIAFDGSGHLFLTTGDRGNREYSQQLDNHAGKVLRLMLDGSLPEDNPFIGVKDSLPEIWTYGHRNPQGIYFDNETERLWINEHGPLGGDEVNILSKGGNYGWPVVTHGREYHGPKIGEGFEKEGVIGPYQFWSPSIAPSSIMVYRGDAFKAWEGNLLSTALRGRYISRLVTDSSGRILFEEEIMGDLKERLRYLILDYDGNLIVSTDAGELLKITLREDEMDYWYQRFFKHIDIPGLYASIEIKFFLDREK